MFQTARPAGPQARTGGNHSGCCPAVISTLVFTFPVYFNFSKMMVLPNLEDVLDMLRYMLRLDLQDLLNPDPFFVSVRTSQPNGPFTSLRPPFEQLQDMPAIAA